MFELTFDLSVFDMFAAWDNGACLCSPSARDLLNPAGFIRRSELTIWFSVPSVAMLMQRLRTLKPDTFPSLRLSLFCGEALPWDVAADWQRAAPGSHVENLYGPTEATIACTAYPFDAPRARDEAINGVVPIGLPVGATDVRVVELDSVEEVDVGEDGELLLCGEQVVDGYLDNPEATDRAFVEIDGRRHYRTGDRVRRAGYGEPLVYLGRLDDQIKVLGHRVELGEVEAAVREAAGAPAAAVGWPRTSVGAAGIVAFVADTAADPASIRAQVARRLPDYMVPRELHLIDDLPLNANGKCDRKALLALLET
jgi:non-ribosomal peptide synthetase component F